jgi:hypothetical protein
MFLIAVGGIVALFQFIFYAGLLAFLFWICKPKPKE